MCSSPLTTRRKNAFPCIGNERGIAGSKGKIMIEYGREETEYIAGKHPVMKALTERFGHLNKGMSGEVFSDLVESIVGQMLSDKVACVLTERLRALAGEFTPQNILNRSTEEIRSIGLSRKKAEYIFGLARGVKDGVYDFSALENMTDGEAIGYLTTIKGVGRWTAEMIAEFSLGRKNIFSESDVALRNGIMSAHGYKTLSHRRFESLRKKYSPYASVASLYYYEWNDYINRGGRVETNTEASR